MLDMFSYACWPVVTVHGIFFLLSMSASSLYVFFGNKSIQLLCPFKIRLFVLLLLNFKSSLYILDINPILNI